MGGREDGGHKDVRTYGQMDGQTELKFIRCLQKKKMGEVTHGQTDILFYYYDR